MTSFAFIWLLELTEADNVPQRRFSHKNTLMAAVLNIGTGCALLHVTRVLQIVPVKWHGHCVVLASSFALQLSAGSRLICGNCGKKRGERNIIILRFPLTSISLRYLLGELNAQT